MIIMLFGFGVCRFSIDMSPVTGFWAQCEVDLHGLTRTFTDFHGQKKLGARTTEQIVLAHGGAARVLLPNCGSSVATRHGTKIGLRNRGLKPTATFKNRYAVRSLSECG